MNLISFNVMKTYYRRVHAGDLKKFFRAKKYLPVSIIVPSYNEDETIVESVRAISLLNYPEFEVIVVNDGSTDQTLEMLKRHFGLQRVAKTFRQELDCKQIVGTYESFEYPHLLVIDKVNGGKADALNAGLNIAHFPLFCSVDADSILEEDALLKAARPFMEDERIVAVGGVVRVANGCEIHAGRLSKVGLPKRLLPLFQTVEYLRAFLAGRLAWSKLGIIFIISGAFSVFRKDVVIAAGGYSTETVCEDMEIVVRLHRFLRQHRRSYRMLFLPDPVCWTEVPESIHHLGRQRNRWQRGLMEALIRHWRMLGNPRYGVVGLLGFPFFLMFEMISPMMETMGYLVVGISFAFGILSFKFFLVFFFVSVLYGILLSVAAVILEELSLRRYPKLLDLIVLVAIAIVENFGYRQLQYIFRLSGIFSFFCGNVAWGEMPRRGFGINSEQHAGSSTDL